eukprot:m.158834 g.158834  ORF g.158834 m.158834 type:complete len:57 (+) comp38754_c0_seq1:25-195(+)
MSQLCDHASSVRFHLAFFLLENALQTVRHVFLRSVSLRLVVLAPATSLLARKGRME